MMLRSLDDIIGQRRGERIEVFERKPASELVASKDITRRDQLGRTVVACPAGMVPAAWLELTDDEQRSLVKPPPPVPDGTLIPGPYGGAVVGWKGSGGYMIEERRR